MGLTLVAVLGPLVTGFVHYRVTETLENQTVGLDAVSLFVVAPLALLAAVLVRRRHVAGPAMAMGAGAYTSYMVVQYILGPDYTHLPGNDERMFPLFIALFAAGWMTTLAGWNAISADQLSRSAGSERLIGRLVLPLLGFLAFSRYIPALADWTSGTPTDKNYLAGPTFSWAIAMLDLGVFLPITVATCVGLARRAEWAQKTLFLIVGWFGLVGPAVAAMAISMAVNDDPGSTTESTVFMTILGLAFAGLAGVLYRPLFRTDHRPVG